MAFLTNHFNRFLSNSMFRTDFYDTGMCLMCRAQIGPRPNSLQTTTKIFKNLTTLRTMFLNNKKFTVLLSVGPLGETATIGIRVQLGRDFSNMNFQTLMLRYVSPCNSLQFFVI